MGVLSSYWRSESDFSIVFWRNYVVVRIKSLELNTYYFPTEFPIRFYNFGTTLRRWWYRKAVAFGVFFYLCSPCGVLLSLVFSFLLMLLDNECSIILGYLGWLYLLLLCF